MSLQYVRRTLPWTLAMGLTLGLFACADTPSGGGNNNQLIPCEGDDDCPPGYSCSGNVCVDSSDGGVGDGGGQDPDIVVDPMTLDFGTPLLGVPVELTVTITNIGGGPLEILAVMLEEDGELGEFVAVPEGTLNEELATGASLEVAVSLTSIDSEVDTGRLVIISNDPDEPMLQVALLSELKGDPAVATCVMESADPWSPCVSGPEVIDLGTLTPGAQVTRNVSVSNAGTGNQPLVVSDIYVTNNTGYASLFQLDVFRFVPDAGTPGQYLSQPLTGFPNTPALLEADEGQGDRELVGIAVTFDAGLEGQPVPGEFLVIESDDPDEPFRQIPIEGLIECPPGFYDIDGQPGCEYECYLTNGGVEQCDGLDNDCDGITDNGCPVCGNTVVETGEQCDDGNIINGDGCSSTCQSEGCGNSVVDAGETCDDGNVIGGDGCSATCQVESCGNAVVDAGETCDDGNTTPGDGCSATCQLELCGNNTVDPGETCDDGNTAAGDGCGTTCQIEICGNGVVDPGENCDDGNTAPGDGCDATCQLEPCILSGTYSGHITLPMSPCIVQADTTIPAGQTLTIDAGVVLKFEVARIWQHNDRDLIVEGTLNVNGTAAQPVVFTSYYDDSHAGDTNGDGSATTPARGDWGRVRFQNVGTGALDHVLMRYGGGGNSGACCAANPPTDATLSVSTSALPTLSNLDIGQSLARGAIVSVVGGFASAINDSIFSNNSTLGLEVSGGNALFTLSGLGFEGNGTDGVSITTSGPIVISSCDATANGARGFAVSTSADLTMTLSGASGHGATYGLDVAARSDSTISGNSFFANHTAVRTVPALTEEIVTQNTLQNTQRGVVLTAGTVDLNTTWPDPGYVYVFEGDVTVQAGRTLTLDPGVVIKSQTARIWQHNDRDLTVNGTLNAVGTPAQPITFTSLYDDTVGGDTNVDGVATTPLAGDWGRVHFASNSGGSLQFVEVYYGGGGNSGACCAANPSTDGAISVSSTTAPSLDDLVVRYSLSRGMYLNVSGGFTSTVTNAELTHNGTHGIEVVHGLGPVVLDTLELASNGADGLMVTAGGAVTLQHLNIQSNGQDGISLSAGGVLNLSDSTINDQVAGIGLEVTGALGGSTVVSTVVSGNDRVARVVPDLVETVLGASNTLSSTLRGLWIVGGNVTGSTTWDAPGFEFVVEGDLTVNSGVTLDLAAGVVLKMLVGNIWQHNDRDLIVNGTLDIGGTAVLPVVVSSYTDDTAGGDTNLDGVASTPVPGDWGRIRYNTGSSGTVTYLEARYGGGGNSGACCAANPPTDAILSVAATVSFADCLIGWSLADGAAISGGTGTLSNCAFENNAAWGVQFNAPLTCTNWTQSGNTFSGNGTGDLDGC